MGIQSQRQHESWLCSTASQHTWSPATITHWQQALRLCRPSDRRLSAKLVPTFANIECHVVRVTDPYGRILGLIWDSQNKIFRPLPTCLKLKMKGRLFPRLFAKPKARSGLWDFILVNIGGFLQGSSLREETAFCSREWKEDTLPLSVSDISGDTWRSVQPTLRKKSVVCWTSSLPCSQEPSAGSYPMPDQFSPSPPPSWHLSFISILSTHPQVI
jgi:hypothetical protein